MKSLFVKLPQSSLQVLTIAEELDTNAALQKFICDKISLTEGDYWLDWRDGALVSIRLRLRGGKGGFGSNLRAQGNKMSSKRRRIGNDSCRDLSGQRLRTINQNKLIADYMARKPAMDRKREAEIREKMLKAVEAPDRRPVFSDVEYLRTARETIDMVESAVYEALLGNFGDDNEDKDENEDENEQLESGLDSNDDEEETETETDTDTDIGTEKDKGKEKAKFEDVDDDAEYSSNEAEEAGPSEVVLSR